MHIVAIHGWQKDEDVVARIIADILGLLVFEARQKIVGGGPVVLATFADQSQAEALAARLLRDGIPALVLDTAAMRRQSQPFPVRRFVLAAQELQLESLAGEHCAIAYGTIELLLVATSSLQRETTATVTERKFSIGKTLLAGGVPMSKKVTHQENVTSVERDETLWLYAQGRATALFARDALNYDGFGSAMQMSRDRNFAQLKNGLRSKAPQAGYDDRLLKAAGIARLLGPSLSPESNLDLACEILARSLSKAPAGG